MKHISIKNIFVFNIRLALTTLMLIGAIYPIYAQTGAGSIQGTVRDTTGANIPGARVKITHIATAQTRETVSNEAGTFLIPSLPIGEYKITITMTGMKTWEGTLLLQVGQSASVSPTMEVGAVGDVVTIVGDVTQLISTNDSTIGNTLDRSRIEQLPVNTRNIGSLILATTPGIEEGGSGYRVGGMRAAAFEIIQDGAVLANRDFGGTAQQPPGMDTIQEIRVETNGSSAKFNRPGTALVTTKPGKNILFGSLFETHRNNGLGQSRRRQDAYADGKAPQFIRNEFGASVGGPITIPKLYNGENRSFFFVAYEGLELREGRTGRFSVPTLAMRQGDFSGLVNASNQLIKIYDPLTTRPQEVTVTYKSKPTKVITAMRDQFPDNKIPLSRLSPLAKRLYEITPLPTSSDNPLINANWTGPLPNNQSRDMFTTRLDHKFGEQDQAYIRYSKGSNLIMSPSTASATGALTTLDRSANLTFVAGKTDSAAMTWTHTFSPSLYGETIVGLTYEKQQVYTGTEPNKNWAEGFGLPNPFNQKGFPAITGTGFIGYTQTDTTRMHYNITGNVDQNFTWVKSNHTLEFGGRFRQSKLHVLPDQQPPATAVDFGSSTTALLDPNTILTEGYTATSQTGNSAASLFLGMAGSYGVRLRRSWYRMREREAGFFIQDNFKATPRLTINAGLRWELHPALHEKENLFTGFDPKTKTILNGRPLEELYSLNLTTPAIIKNFENVGAKFDTPSIEKYGVPDNFFGSNMYDFAPRFGAAYRMFGGKKELVVRSGYGIYIYPPPARNYYANTRFNPPYTIGFSTSLNSSTQSLDKFPNYLLRSIPQTIAGLNSANAVDVNSTTTMTRGGFGITYFDPEFPSTRSHQWNFTLEKELFKNIVVRASYLGQHANKLEQFEELNSGPNAYLWIKRTGTLIPTKGDYANVATRPFDNQTYGSVERVAKTGWSNTNQFEFEFERRYAKGWGFQMFYTLNNTLSVAGNGWREDYIAPVTSYDTGAVPTDTYERNRFTNYMIDTEVTKHRVRWNWIVDLPFGKGKKFGDTSNRFLNAFIGGWQLSGIGTLRSTFWGGNTGGWGSASNIEVYGKKHEVWNCTSTDSKATSTDQERCYPGYLWFNGYISPDLINRYNTNGIRTGVFGLPENYKPAQKPIIEAPANYRGEQPKTKAYEWCTPGRYIWEFYNSNSVCMPLADGTSAITTYSPGPHERNKLIFLGPFNWTQDISMSKTFNIREGMNLRFNADIFNLFNKPGLNAPGSSGIASKQSSFNTPRQMQFSLRLSF